MYVDEFEKFWRMHPDKNVDLCAMPIAPLINLAKSQGKELFYLTLDAIHPQYHNNVKKLVGEDCISVLVNGLESDADIRGRATEDDSFYEIYREEEFDLIYMYDKNRSKEDNAKIFYRKLMAYINTADMFPPSKIIDVKNVTGYSKIANEFTEEKRITTKNFHKVSQNFWEHFIGKLHIGDSVLNSDLEMDGYAIDLNGPLLITTVLILLQI